MAAMGQGSSSSFIFSHPLTRYVVFVLFGCCCFLDRCVLIIRFVLLFDTHLHLVLFDVAPSCKLVGHLMLLLLSLRT